MHRAYSYGTYIRICTFIFSHNQNHVQLWVQVLEKFNEEIDDFQPALVEEDRLTNTGGIFVLAKVRMY